MIRKKLFYGLFILTAYSLFTLFFTELTFAASESNVIEKKTISRVYDPIEIPAKHFQQLLGDPLEKIVLYAYLNGQFKPAPFQIDELTQTNDFVLPEGPGGDPENANKLLDPQDLLVFMIADCGDRVSKNEFPLKINHVIEIEISDPIDNSKGWVYLIGFKNKPLISKFPPKIVLLHNKDAFVAHGTTWATVRESR